MGAAARTVAAVEAVVEGRDVAAWSVRRDGRTGGGRRRRRDRTAGAAATTTPFFEQERGHAPRLPLTAAPLLAPDACTRNSPGRGTVVTTHVGEHDGIEVTYGALGPGVVENAMSVAGPVREVVTSSALVT